MYMCVFGWWMNQWINRLSYRKYGEWAQSWTSWLWEQRCYSGSETWAGNLWNIIAYYPKESAIPRQESSFPNGPSWPERTLKQLGRRSPLGSCSHPLPPQCTLTLERLILFPKHPHLEMHLNWVAHRCPQRWAFPLWAKEAAKSQEPHPVSKKWVSSLLAGILKGLKGKISQIQSDY